MPISTDPDDPSIASGNPDSPDDTGPGEVLPADSSWRERLSARVRGKGRQDAIFLGIASIWIAFDQITKVILRETLDVGDHSVVTSFFRFSNVLNDGGAFGLFGGANVVLALSALVATVVIGLYYLFPPVDHWATRLGLALILGGAVGNLLDRIYQGSVTDFVNFSHFPAFNVADAGINIGVAVIIIHMIVMDAKRGAIHR